jgi:putative transposase
MREKIIAGQIYHVLSRGVDKRKIFLDNEDHFRFIHDLFEFNDIEPVNNLIYNFRKIKDAAHPYIVEKKKPRKLLVEILAFCLMPNHYHLLVQPKSDSGLFQFMKKLNIGYAKYFNEKYKRKGALFEGRYKSIVVEEEPHFVHLPYYIHFNPLDLKFPEWREGGLRDIKRALEFLESYRWSSHLDYFGIKNFPSVTQRDFLEEIFGGVDEYKNNIKNWLGDLSLENIKELSLE